MLNTAMLDSIVRSRSRTLAPVLCVIGGLLTVAFGSIGLRALGGVLDARDQAALERAWSQPPPGGWSSDTMYVPELLPEEKPTVYARHVTMHAGDEERESGVVRPSVIAVRPGDVVRFTTDGKADHNIIFAPEDNPGVRGLPWATPYLSGRRDAFDVHVNLEPGVYYFRCAIHGYLGERGVLEVFDASTPIPDTANLP